jgi:hypothetical protein
VALYKGFARKEKLGIQIQQNPAASENSWICLLVVRIGIEQTACFCFAPEALLALRDVESQVFNLVLANLSLFFRDTLYPASQRRQSKSSVPLRQSWWLVAVRRSSTYCKRVQPVSPVRYACKSDARAVLKIVGEF